MRLIDADSIIAFVNAGHLINPSALSWSDNDVVDMIDSRPTIDAVPVVRCKNCKWFAGEGMYCANDIIVQFDHFYCYHGERKDDG